MLLEPVMAYILLAEKQCSDVTMAGSYNIGPDEQSCVTTGELVTLFCKIWYDKTGERIKWVNKYDGGPHEASYLKLDCSRFKKRLNWHPQWSIEKAVEKSIEVYRGYYQSEDIINQRI